jgi:ADP-ribose pyrophosphatase YjhB (NUDIX family)
VSDISLHLKVEKPFGALLHKRQVFIAVFTPSGKLILCRNSYYYPQGMYRLVGGEITDKESPAEAAMRQLEVELGLSMREADLFELDSVDADAEDVLGQTYLVTTSLFAVTLPKGAVVEAGEDIDELKEFTQGELEELVYRFKRFPRTMWRMDESGQKRYRWYDYGQLYGPIHEVILEEMKHMHSLSVLY